MDETESVVSESEWAVLPRPSHSRLLAPLPDFHRIKVISLGAAGVGKSCLIKRYCEKQVF